VKYTETGIVKRLGEGLWKTAQSLPRYRLNLYDPETGGIGIHAVLKERGLESLLWLRLKVEAGRITEVEALIIPGDSRIVGYQQEDLTTPSRLWSRAIPAPLLPEADRRENGILYTNTKIGSSMLSTARSGFDAGRFKGMQVRDRRYPVVDSSDRCGDEPGALRRSDGAAQQGLTAVRPAGQAAAGAGCDGRCFVRQRDLCGVAGEDRGNQCVLDSERRECEDAVGAGGEGLVGASQMSTRTGRRIFRRHPCPSWSHLRLSRLTTS